MKFRQFWNTHNCIVSPTFQSNRIWNRNEEEMKITIHFSHSYPIHIDSFGSDALLDPRDFTIHESPIVISLPINEYIAILWKDRQYPTTATATLEFIDEKEIEEPHEEQLTREEDVLFIVDIDNFCPEHWLQNIDLSFDHGFIYNRSYESSLLWNPFDEKQTIQKAKQYFYNFFQLPCGFWSATIAVHVDVSFFCSVIFNYPELLDSAFLVYQQTPIVRFNLFETNIPKENAIPTFASCLRIVIVCREIPLFPLSVDIQYLKVPLTLHKQILSEINSNINIFENPAFFF